MKRPSFQFYPADWKNNSKLRRCSDAARGAWVDVLCLLHDSDEYGVCRWPLAEIAQASGVHMKLIKELVAKDVLKGANSMSGPYIFTPRHAGKDGEPIVLVEHKDGPVWYCSRFVRDEYIRMRRGQTTQFTPDNQPPKPTPKAAPKPPIGYGNGDGPTSPSTSASTLKASVPTGTGENPPNAQNEDHKTPEELTKDELWAVGKSILEQGGMPKAQAGSFLGKLVKDYGNDVVIESVRGAVVERPADAVSFLKASCMARKNEGGKSLIPWHATDAGVIAKGAEINMKPNPGESSFQFKARLIAFIEAKDKPPNPKSGAPPTVLPVEEQVPSLKAQRGEKPEGMGSLKSLIKPREAA